MVVKTRRLVDNCEEFYIKEKMSNGQTLEMGFEEISYNNSSDTIYWNIYLSVYSKRKHKEQNEEMVISTGKNPMLTIATGLKAFKILMNHLTIYYSEYNNFVYCFWTDNTRRNAYYRFLKKHGFQYYMIDNKKVLGKLISQN